MKRMDRAAIGKVIYKITNGKHLLQLIANSGFKECVDGLEMIRDRTEKKPFDFAAFIDRFIKDFMLWVDGQNGDIFFHDPFAEKNNLLLKEMGEIREPVPMIKKEMVKVIENLSEWIARPEFQKDKIKPKDHYTKREAADILSLTVGRIDQLVYEEKLKFMSNKLNRKNCRVILGADLIEYRRKNRK